jgi:hypothetical protein
METDEFTRDLRAMLDRGGSEAPASLRGDVLGVRVADRSTSLGSKSRSAAHLGGSAVMSVAAIVVLGGVVMFGLSARTRNEVTGAAIPSAAAFCGQAIRTVTIGHSASVVTFTDPGTGVAENLVFPTALSARVTDGMGELVNSDGRVIGTDGDVLTLGGAAGRGASTPFFVCTVNGTTYPLP